VELVVAPEVIDALGHVNNAAYIGFVETIARAHADSVGITSNGMADLGGAFVVRKHEATYFGEAKEGDRLLLQTWVGSFGGSRCTRHVQILKDEKKIFECKTEWVWIDAERRTPKRMPADFGSRFKTGAK
jgi:acyl-CoA thioester hydrolase